MDDRMRVKHRSLWRDTDNNDLPTGISEEKEVSLPEKGETFWSKAWNFTLDVLWWPIGQYRKLMFKYTGRFPKSFKGALAIRLLEETVHTTNVIHDEQVRYNQMVADARERHLALFNGVDPEPDDPGTGSMETRRLDAMR